MCYGSVKIRKNFTEITRRAGEQSIDFQYQRMSYCPTLMILG